MAAPPAAPAPDGADNTVNFMAFGDSQTEAEEGLPGDPNVGKTKKYRYGEVSRNRLQVELMNRIENYKWPIPFKGARKNIDRMRGVIVAGDLTETGDYDYTEGMAMPPRLTGEWELFLDLYGFCGDRRLKYPLFEGFGNHDFVEGAPPGHYTPVIDSIKRRNVFRKRMGAITNYAGPHYSWDWGNLHFVQLNLEASNTPYTATSDGRLGPRKVELDPMNALTFLREDLKNFVGKSNKGVIIITHFHYPDDGNQKSTKYSTAKELNDLHAVIKNYNMVAILHGHTHSAGRAYEWKGIPVFDLGTPYYNREANNYMAHFTIFKISHGYLQAADVAWDVNTIKERGKPNRYEIKSVTVGEDIPGRSWGSRVIPIKVPKW